MTEREGAGLKMWQPVRTPQGEGLAQAWIIKRTGERLLQVSHRLDGRLVYGEYPIDQVELKEQP